MTNTSSVGSYTNMSSAGSYTNMSSAVSYTIMSSAGSYTNMSSADRNERGCSLSFQMEFSGIIFKIISLPIIFFGILTNILSVLVFYKKIRRTSTTVCLITLCVADGLHCLFFLPSALNLYPYTGTLSAMYKYSGIMKNILRPLVNLMKTVSVYLLGLLSLERLLAVSAPTKFPIWFTIKRMTLYIVALVLAAVVLVIPQFVFWGNQPKYDACLQDIRFKGFFRGGRNTYFALHYSSKFFPVFAYGFPLFVIVGCNVGSFILMKVKRIHFHFKSTKMDRRFNIMVFAVVGASTICFLPNAILPGIYRIIMDRELKNGLRATRHLFGLVNSAINILVYFSLGPKFRESLLGLLRLSSKTATPSKADGTSVENTKCSEDGTVL